jgi:protocatechuate 3,4-dioxygenase beta subunit
VWVRNEPVQLTLQAAAFLRGRVLGPDGTPVAGVHLNPRETPMILLEDDRIFSAFPESSPPCPDANSATSDEDGRFELPSLLPGRYHFDIFADGLTADDPYPVQLAEGDAVEGFEIRLQSDGSRSGRLIEPGGAPLPSAYVTASDEDGDYETDYSWDGTFRFTPRKPGPVTLRIKADGYETLERTIDPAADADPIEVLLVRDGSWKTVRGRVTGFDGKPIAGAEVYVVAEGLATRSAADGSFELPLSLREPRPIEIFKDGFATVRLELGPETPLPERMTIRLEPGATVAGRLLGLTPGDRGPDARVTLYRAGGPDFDAPLGADNTFRFEHVPSGAWKLGLSARYRSATKRVLVKPGQTEVAADLSLPPMVLVSGRVLDPQGQPLAGADLLASQEDEPVAAGGTGSDGRFVLYLPKGRVQLTASLTGFQGGPLEVPVGRRPVTKLVIRLEPEPDPTVMATGRVLGLAPGETAEIVGILDEPDRTVYSRAQFEGDGFEFPLEAGVWDLQGFLYDAAGAFLRKVRWSVDIPAGSTEMELELDLASAKPIPEEP